MSTTTSREIRLALRPTGMPSAANFSLETTALEAPSDGQILVRNLYMSVDPYMRGRMNDRKSYVAPFEIGKPLNGGAVGEVIESRSDEFKSGDIVLHMYGWREYCLAAAGDLQKVNQDIQPPSVYLGALGMPGMTAWAGLNLVDVKAGDVVFISGAAGAVGSVAGQLAKLRGCTVIGSAGSSDKMKFLLDDCGYDFAFNYNDGTTLEQLTKVATNGIDVYFDNVGGATLEAALNAMRLHGRIIACGSISAYNAETPQPGPTNMHTFITKRLTMKGLIVSDSMSKMGEFLTEVGGYYAAGKLKSKETVVKGIENAPEAFIGLFQGKNIGKMVVEL